MGKKASFIAVFAVTMLLFACAPLPIRAEKWYTENPLGIAADSLGTFLFHIDHDRYEPFSKKQIETIKEILEKAKIEIVAKTLDEHSGYSPPQKTNGNASKDASFGGIGVELDVFEIISGYNKKLVEIIKKNVPEYDFKNGGLTDMLIDWLTEKNPEAAKLKESIQKQIIPEKGIRIYGTTPGGPAEKAGLKTGWHIVAVDGKKTTGRPLDEVLNQIKGPVNTKVKLTLATDVSGSEIAVEITRQIIRPEPAKKKMGKMIEPEIGYITFSEFYTGVEKDFIKSLKSLTANGMKNLIFDLRNNPGGELNSAKEIANYLIGSGVKVIEKYRTEKKATYYIGEPIFSGKIILLINKWSASASEIIAAALRDYQKAIIVGETSFGKGSIQSRRNLPDGSILRVTSGRWYTMKNECVDNKGIKPDINIADDPATPQDEILEKAMKLAKEQLTQ